MNIIFSALTVRILVKKCFNATEITLANDDVIKSNLNVEFLSLKVQYRKNNAFIVGCLYRPPKQNSAQIRSDAETIEHILCELVLLNKNFYLLGDFNLPNTREYSHLESLLTTYNLTQVINTNTRGNARLDLIITNNFESIRHTEVFDPHISDHSCVLASLVFKRPVYEKRLLRIAISKQSTTAC